jgi:hypothetical protein
MALFKRKPSSSSYGKRGDSPHGGDSKTPTAAEMLHGKNAYNLTGRQVRKNLGAIRADMAGQRNMWTGISGTDVSSFASPFGERSQAHEDAGKKLNSISKPAKAPSGKPQLNSLGKSLLGNHFAD